MDRRPSPHHVNNHPVCRNAVHESLNASHTYTTQRTQRGFSTRLLGNSACCCIWLTKRKQHTPFVRGRRALDPETVEGPRLHALLATASSGTDATQRCHTRHIHIYIQHTSCHSTHAILVCTYHSHTLNIHTTYKHNVHQCCSTPVSRQPYYC